MKQGTIFGIQHFSIHDGPGIRTVVFLKGCNMRCAWCHNPEGISAQPELCYAAGRCVLCGKCAEVCPQGVHTVSGGVHRIDRSGCTACGRCVAACPQQALSIAGSRAKVDEIIALLLRDRPYYQASGGGLTVSGGEPTCQPGFLKSLLTAARGHGLHTALETNGAAAFSLYRELAPYVDLFLFDYKETGSARHARVTGLPNSRIVENLSRLNEAGADIILRCPVIPGINDTPAHFRAIAEITRTHKNIRGFELMPYHRYGTAKARQLGSSEVFAFVAPTREEAEKWRAEIRGYGGREYDAGGGQV